MGVPGPAHAGTPLRSSLGAACPAARRRGAGGTLPTCPTLPPRIAPALLLPWHHAQAAEVVWHGGARPSPCRHTAAEQPRCRVPGGPPPRRRGHPAAATNKFANYLALIRPNLPLGIPAPHPHEVSNPAHLFALCRFRCSCHDLRIERERYLPPEIKAPRHHRTCLCCASTAIEDENHMVFHCPIYERLRFQYADLFSPPPPSLASFLSQNQTRVASFIHNCLVLRRQHA